MLRALKGVRLASVAAISRRTAPIASTPIASTPIASMPIASTPGKLRTIRVTPRNEG
jgi:hypothetical protein